MSSTPTPSIAENAPTFTELRDAFTALDTSLTFRKPHKPTIKLGTRPYTYSIESDDKPGVFYTTDAYHMTCTCMAGRHHKRCWHLAAAIQYDAWRKAQRAKSAAPAPVIPRPAGMAALVEAFA